MTTHTATGKAARQPGVPEGPNPGPNLVAGLAAGPGCVIAAGGADSQVHLVGDRLIAAAVGTDAMIAEAIDWLGEATWLEESLVLWPRGPRLRDFRMLVGGVGLEAQCGWLIRIDSTVLGASIRGRWGMLGPSASVGRAVAATLHGPPPSDPAVAAAVAHDTVEMVTRGFGTDTSPSVAVVDPWGARLLSPAELLKIRTARHDLWLIAQHHYARGGYWPWPGSAAGRAERI